MLVLENAVALGQEFLEIIVVKEDNKLIVITQYFLEQ
jgi:hypothetical protein